MLDTAARPAPAPVSLWQHVASVLAWLDDAAPDPRSRDQAALRLLKVAEETGEAVSAYIGMTGQNPRKGTCATASEVTGELCDVVIAALVALATLTGDARRAEARLRAHLAARSARLATLTGT